MLILDKIKDAKIIFVVGEYAQSDLHRVSFCITQHIKPLKVIPVHALLMFLPLL